MIFIGNGKMIIERKRKQLKKKKETEKRKYKPGRTRIKGGY